MFQLYFRRALTFTKDEVWSKVVLFCFILFLARIADGIISFWAPVQIQSALSSSTIMGFIISFQSLVGFAADLVFPKMLRSAKARGLVFWGILMSALTALLLGGSTYWPFVAIFLVTMALWGIYYELIAFANYQFMGGAVPLSMRSAAWGIAGIFVNLAYFLGPLMGAFLLLKGSLVLELSIMFFLTVSLILLFTTKKVHEPPVVVDLSEINPWVELKHWLTLSKHIWPAIVISLILGFIDSTFWTTGAVWTEKLSQMNGWGSFFLPAYQFPAIIMGFLVARWGIYKGKKILSEKILIVAGIFLMAIILSTNVFWQIGSVLAASIAIAVCYPLIEGVYTDIIARMGKEKKEMIGLTSSVTNIAYIVWPPVAGFVAGMVGERMTFGIVGGMTVIVALILLFVTPKKLRLPQEEIKNWE